MGDKIILADGTELKVPDPIDEETSLLIARATVAGSEDRRPPESPAPEFSDPDAGMEEFDELQSAGVYRRDPSEEKKGENHEKF